MIAAVRAFCTVASGEPASGDSIQPSACTGFESMSEIARMVLVKKVLSFIVFSLKRIDAAVHEKLKRSRREVEKATQF